MISKKITNKIWDRQNAATLADELRSKGKKLVFTNGVFDILHAGHVNYLADAADLADCLIIGVNSDDSVKRLGKSPARPLQSQLSRSMVLASLQWVYAVVIFNEDTPAELIEEIKPDVLVKGSDYRVENIAGANGVLSRGGQVKTIQLLDGFSTTAIENKILEEHR